MEGHVLEDLRPEDFINGSLTTAWNNDFERSEIHPIKKGINGVCPVCGAKVNSVAAMNYGEDGRPSTGYHFRHEKGRGNHHCEAQNRGRMNKWYRGQQQRFPKKYREKIMPPGGKSYGKIADLVLPGFNPYVMEFETKLEGRTTVDRDTYHHSRNCHTLWVHKIPLNRLNDSIRIESFTVIDQLKYSTLPDEEYQEIIDSNAKILLRYFVLFGDLPISHLLNMYGQVYLNLSGYFFLELGPDLAGHRISDFDLQNHGLLVKAVAYRPHNKFFSPEYDHKEVPILPGETQIEYQDRINCYARIRKYTKDSRDRFLDKYKGSYGKFLREKAGQRSYKGEKFYPTRTRTIVGSRSPKEIEDFFALFDETEIKQASLGGDFDPVTAQELQHLELEQLYEYRQKMAAQHAVEFYDDEDEGIVGRSMADLSVFDGVAIEDHSTLQNKVDDMILEVIELPNFENIKKKTLANLESVIRAKEKEKAQKTEPGQPAIQPPQDEITSQPPTQSSFVANPNPLKEKTPISNQPQAPIRESGYCTWKIDYEKVNYYVEFDKFNTARQMNVYRKYGKKGSELEGYIFEAEIEWLD